MRIQTDAATLKEIFTAISAVVEDATITADPEGLTFRGMDPSHVMLLDMQYAPADFTAFECAESMNLGVRAKDMAKVIGRLKGKVTLTTEDSYLVLEAEAEVGVGGKKFKNHLIEGAVPSSTPLPKVPFTVSFELPRSDLLEILKDAQVYAPNAITITATPRATTLSATTETDEYVHTFEPNMPSGEEQKTSYTLDYLLSIVSALPDGPVRVEFASMKPICLTVPHMRFWLAPRVQD